MVWDLKEVYIVTLRPWERWFIVRTDLYSSPIIWNLFKISYLNWMANLQKPYVSSLNICSSQTRKLWIPIGRHSQPFEIELLCSFWHYLQLFSRLIGSLSMLESSKLQSCRKRNLEFPDPTHHLLQFSDMEVAQCRITWKSLESHQRLLKNSQKDFYGLYIRNA